MTQHLMTRTPANRTGFRVFDRREKLSKLHKGVILGGYLMHGWLHRSESR